MEGVDLDLRGQDPALAGRLERLAVDARIVFITGLPGTGKSLVIRELARTAAAQGRAIHTVQWDVARPVFEAAPAGRRYPIDNGVTHVVIRRAAGLWVRDAVARWHAAHAGAAHLLIGELPLVGGRFIELAKPAPDPAEPVLTAASSRFVIPVPSHEVRAFAEHERDRRMAQPAHVREREDAPSHVLRALWDELAAVARTLRLSDAAPGTPYDPEVYEAVYRRVLRRRHVEALPLTRVLDVRDTSAYDLGVPARELLPSPAEVERVIAGVEARYPGVDWIARETTRWYSVP